jgi:hypothetical protein
MQLLERSCHADGHKVGCQWYAQVGGSYNESERLDTAHAVRAGYDNAGADAEAQLRRSENSGPSLMSNLADALTSAQGGTGRGSGAAYRESAADAASGNPNYVQTEVGGYSGHFTTSGGVTTITLSNVSGISSLSGYSAGVGAINSATGSHMNRNALDMG